jgi:hypothetical protein
MKLDGCKSDSWNPSTKGKVVLVQPGCLADELAHSCLQNQCAGVVLETAFMKGFSSAAGYISAA